MALKSSMLHRSEKFIERITTKISLLPFIYKVKIRNKSIHHLQRCIQSSKWKEITSQNGPCQHPLSWRQDSLLAVEKQVPHGCLLFRIRISFFKTHQWKGNNIYCASCMYFLKTWHWPHMETLWQASENNSLTTNTSSTCLISNCSE